MGLIIINTKGSFGTREAVFGAMAHGHAHAVADAMTYLSGGVLRKAIDLDHQLHDDYSRPEKGFQKLDPHTSTEANAVLAFAAWLTTRDEEIKAGAHAECGDMASIVDDYIRFKLLR